ncbi:protein Wnt-8b-like isoform X2 [Ostrea edulis]|uniref:protein Wnt-8b-like isoform X2 n=1 Tax=Ostrea edulis TaxID=37623 RepID=UPI0020950F3A|nr:protein Wnt-8b-like isoform X2 [Ostrea edulis]
MNRYPRIWRPYFLIFLIYQAKSWSLNKSLMTGPNVGIRTNNGTMLISFSSNHKSYGLFVDAIERGTPRVMQGCKYQLEGDRWNCDNISKLRSLNKILMTGPKFGILTDNATMLIPFSTNHKWYGLFMDAIGRGAQRAMQECQYQFQWDRWNCDITSAPLLHSEQLGATKEAAFVQSITSAGVMYSLIRQCSSGSYNVCSCDKSKQGREGGYDWIWGGCSDDVKVGERVARTLLDTLVTKRDGAAAMHLHNNMAGRKAVSKSMRMMCKCHGPTGSCSWKTCWKELPKFRKIGRYLKRRYSYGLRLDFNEKLKDENDPRRRSMFPVLPGSSLVYIERSPNHCKANKTYGISGTLNRECSRRHKAGKVRRSERKSCRNLCRRCGYSVQKRTVEITSTCNCKFRWCCKVNCDTCVVYEDRYFCVK